jgi:hypothetical protein
MKDEELKKSFERSDIPELDEGAKDRIVSAAIRRFREVSQETGDISSDSFTDKFERWWGPVWKPALAFSVCVLIISIIYFQRTSELSKQVNDLQYEIAMLKEYKNLFSGKMKALVNHNGQVDLVLGGNSLSQNNPAVVIDFKNNGEHVRIVGFSGQPLTFKLGKQEIQIDVLLNAENKILLVGNDFVWQEKSGDRIQGYQVDTQVLGVDI